METTRARREPAGRGLGGSRRRAGPAPSHPCLPARPAAALAAALLLAGACGPGETGRPEGTLVVVSVPPLAGFVERLAGEAAEVEVMVPPGASPALYEPTMRQMELMAEARLYVAVGHPRFPFERAWLGRLRELDPQVPVLAAGAGCDLLAEDPHLWLSPRCARAMAERIAAALGKVLPPGDGGELLDRRRRGLGATMDSVDAEIRALLAPHRGRSFLVFHPALGYLARDYGLHQLSIQRGASEPGPAELARVVRRAKEQGIRTVFVQPQFSREAARLVAAELPGGRLATVDPLARDWAPNLVATARALADSFGGVGGGARGVPR